jgi:hypothetical protein
MLNILCPISAALITVTTQMGKPDYDPAVVVVAAAIAAGLSYGWCRLVDWMLDRGHNLP